MRDRDVGLVPIVDEAGKPLGTVTDRDIALRVVAEGRDPGGCTAQDCMTTPATSIGVDGSLADATERMESEQIRRMLVVDQDGRLCGVVAQADIALSGRDHRTAELVRGVSEPKH
jgi:CBS domain-containing protein